jgi:1,4-dihydroxy-2-naphthoate octaprenyltransferase
MAEHPVRPRGEDRAPEPRGDDAPGALSGLMRIAGVRYWTASVLPVLVGSTLPFWLRPNGFAFGWLRLFEALVAAVLLHAGSALVRAKYGGEAPGASAQSSPLRAALVCYAVGGAIGLHLNAAVPGNYILAVGLAGMLGGFFYSAPPLRLSHRGLGEIVVAACLGILPVAGAYYAQTGQMSPDVYMASLPTTFALVLWLWVSEIRDLRADREAGRRKLAVILGSAVSARAVVPALSLFIFASLFAAVFTASMIPLALVAVLAFGLVRTVVAVSWSHRDSPERMAEALDSAFKLHMAVGIIVAASALAAIGS